MSSINSSCDLSLAGPPAADRRISATMLGTLAAAAVFVVASGLWSVATFGGIEPGLAYLGGQELYLPRSSIALGEIAAGRTKGVKVEVRNLSATPLTILGAQTDCSCTTTAGLPLELSARSSGTVEIYVTPFPRDAGETFERQVALLTDRASGRVLVSLTGHVVR